MNTTTLKGVFPEPKPVPRRNFMRENIKQLKQMQGLVDRETAISQSQVSMKINPKYRHVPSRVFSNLNNRPSRGFNFETRKPFALSLRNSAPDRPPHDKRTVNRGVQTERPEDAGKFLESPNLSPKAAKKLSPLAQQQQQARSDQRDSLAKSIQKLGIDEKHDYVKANIKNIRQKFKDESSDAISSRKDHQKGAVSTKTTSKSIGGGEDKSNLALLPDDERKEYLRVARENYAGLIKELNTMPIRNDTLKKRNRKIQIEEELKRLDEVIRIFQKPKVFVKADA